MTALIVIPARYESSRFHGKLMKTDHNGKTVLQHVWDNAICSSASKVVVATDSEIIGSEVSKWGTCVMTGQHSCGTDRAAEAWVKDQDKYDVIVNLQADEVEITSEYINALIELSSTHGQDDSMITMATPLCRAGDYQDPNVVKVVCGEPDYVFNPRCLRALYFSRSPIPNQKRLDTPIEASYLHIGIYAFKPNALMRFISRGQSALERIERLEQLRALAFGMRIDVVMVDRPPNLSGRWPIAINSPQDLGDWLRR